MGLVGEVLQSGHAGCCRPRERPYVIPSSIGRFIKGLQEKNMKLARRKCGKQTVLSRGI